MTNQKKKSMTTEMEDTKANGSKNSYKKLLLVIYVSVAVVFLGTIIRSLVIAGRQTRYIHDPHIESAVPTELVELNDGWILHHENGETEMISLPYQLQTDEAEITITHEVTGLFRPGDVIKFDNNRQGVIVSVDEKTLYEVNTTELTRQVSFTDYQLVAIPDEIEAHELSLRFVHKIRDYYEILPVTYGSYNCARNELIYNDLLTLLLLGVFLVLLLVVVIISVYSWKTNIMDIRVIDLGLFIMLAIIWGYTDSYLPALSMIPQETLGVMSYLSIMLLPGPICHFVWASCNKKYKAFQIVTMAAILNLLVEAILSSFGIFQLQNTFYSAHIIIIAVIIVSIISIYITRKENKGRDVDILYSSILLLAVVAAVSLILYWRKGGLYYRICMLLGIFLFSALLFVYVIVLYVQKMHATQLAISESKIHEWLSKFDELTGLPNRRSFENKMSEIEEKIEKMEDAILIMMDVNGLKIVNDQYGHSAGDDLIISAARVIAMTFGSEGNCFRIGGDEFVVILEDLSVPMAVYERVFEENLVRINENSRWKLSIAKGVSHLENAYGQKLSISDWKQVADINMYRNKLSTAGTQSRDRAKDLNDIINCIISTVEAKDTYTAAHSERVRELSYCIGKKLGVSESTIQNLEIAAHLHDIGKIAVPDYILLKPGNLSEDEYEKIKQHTQIGAKIIGQAKGMQEIANIVLHHHERWDGTGYPEGLSQEEIPLESRIIALADSIDAMTSKRIYRESMPLDVCRKIIEENSSLMYDPAITKIVLEHWNDIVDIVLLHPKRLIEQQGS